MNIMTHTECGTTLYVVLWRWRMNTLTSVNKRLFVLCTRSTLLVLCRLSVLLVL